MVSEQDVVWRDRIEAALAMQPVEPDFSADAILDIYPTDSRPLKVSTDGGDFVVKAAFPHKRDGASPLRVTHRVMAGERVTHRLGLLLGAPVPKSALVSLPLNLLTINEARLQSASAPAYIAGVCHGSSWEPDLGPRLNNTANYGSLQVNRTRLASLAVLYGLVGIQADEQLFVKATGERLVFSLDHGFAFEFCSGAQLDTCTGWTVSSLNASTGGGVHEGLKKNAALQIYEVQEALQRVDAVTDDAIAIAVALPPDTWECGMGERIALARYFARRRDVLLGLRFE